MDAGFKVYVLTALREHESYNTSNEVVGVYQSHEGAERAMNDALDEEIVRWKENTSMEDKEHAIRRGSEMCSIYDTIGGIEYTKFSISERILRR